METSGGILGRLFEKVLGYITLGLIVLCGLALWRIGPEGRTAIWNAIWRTAVWLGLAAGLPWLTRLFIARVLEIGSNWAGAALLAVLTGIDLLVGRLLMQGWPDSLWGWIAALTALAMAGLYNYLVTEYLAEQAGG